MKNRLSLISLIVALCISLLPSPANAVADAPAKTIAEAYKAVIDSTDLFAYANNNAVAFYDLNGDGIPEMFLWADGDPQTTLTDLQCWTYHNGSAKKAGSIRWGMASSGNTLYVSTEGQLISYGSTSSDSYVWTYRDVYSFSPARGLEQIEKVKFTQEYNMDLHAFGKLTCEVNGVIVSEREAKARKDALGGDIAVVLLGDSRDGNPSSMSKREATAYLDVDNFFDVSNNQYYAEPVKWAVENGITNGTGDYTFSPKITCTRAHILTFLWRAVGSPVAGNMNPFSDVNTGDYYYQAALWAYQNGMVSGNRFEGTTPCTRAATVKYIWQSKGSPASGAAAFSDVPAGADYSQAVAWAVENKITDGVGNNQFAPDMICSRGQIVTFLYRARNVTGVSNAENSLYDQAMAAYHDFVSQKHHEDEWSYDIETFALFDMNADGIPELFTTGGGRMDYHKIFTFDGAAVKCVHWGSEFGLYDNGIVYVAFAGGGGYRLYSYYTLNDLTLDLLFRYAEWFGLDGTTYSVGEKAYDENAEKVPHEQIARQLEAILGSAKTVSTQYHENDAAERLAVFG